MHALRLVALFPVLVVALLAASTAAELVHTKRGAGGWNSVQYPTGAVESSIPVKNGELELFAMSKGGLDKTKLKRVVFVIHGEGRDPWNYYNHMTAALRQAKSEGVVSSINQVGIWSAGFWCNADEGVWPASEARAAKRASNKQMVWHNSDWSDGDGSIYPVSNKGVSSFAALDDVIRYFGNRAIFPNLDTIVLAGHSMGAQMLHRYAQVGREPAVTPEVHYYIGNPASYLYLDNRRPNKGIGGATSRSKCPNYNKFKYGLDNVYKHLESYRSSGLDSQSIYNQYKSRFVHYALGTSDAASGSKSCSAHVQGDSHYNRGRIYQAYLELLGYPATHTVDYVRGIGHDAAAMFASKRGMFRLFSQNNGLGRTKTSSAKNGVTDGLQVTFTR